MRIHQIAILFILLTGVSLYVHGAISEETTSTAAVTSGTVTKDTLATDSITTSSVSSNPTKKADTSSLTPSPLAELLTPDQVVVAVNIANKDAVLLAERYMKARGIPANNRVDLKLKFDETISREGYEKGIASPLRRFLENKPSIRCIALMYGVPVKVLEPKVSSNATTLTAMIRLEQGNSFSEVAKLYDASIKLLPDTQTAPKLPELTPQEDPDQKSQYIVETLISVFRLTEPSPEWIQLWHEAFGNTPPSTFGITYSINQSLTPDDVNHLEAIIATPLTPANLSEILKSARKLYGVAGELRFCNVLRQQFKPDWKHRASVDSELCTLFWAPFSLSGNVPNPFYVRMPLRNYPRTLMACRIDATTPKTVARRLSEGLATERKGLKGKVYLDARGREGGDYGAFDESIRSLATFLKSSTNLDVILDNEEAVFAPGSCPEAAIYCGWYSMGKYVNAFSFVPGAVGWHAASVEAMKFHTPGAQTWCPSLIRNGVVATLGPVEEPYLTAFPPPADFFELLLTGRFTLAQCYFMSIPHLSWMMTLIGDPLYNPYKMNPAVDISKLPDVLRHAVGG